MLSVMAALEVSLDDKNAELMQVSRELKEKELALSRSAEEVCARRLLLSGAHSLAVEGPCFVLVMVIVLVMDVCCGVGCVQIEKLRSGNEEQLKRATEAAERRLAEANAQVRPPPRCVAVTP